MNHPSKYAMKRRAKFLPTEYERLNLHDSSAVVKAWDRMQQVSHEARWNREYEAQLEDHYSAISTAIRGYAPVTLPLPLREFIFAATKLGFDHHANDGTHLERIQNIVAFIDRTGLVRAVDFENEFLHFVSDEDAVEFRMRYL